jgi:hypothetical protein
VYVLKWERYARQKGVTFGRKVGSNERKAAFLAKEGSKKNIEAFRFGQIYN